MGKKAKWFSSVKKAFSPDSKKSKHKSPENPNGVISNARGVSSPPPPLPPLEVRVAEVIAERNRELSPPHSTDATTSSDIPVVVVPSSSTYAPPEVVRRSATTATRFLGKSNEEAAAILIQTIFRGYLARRAMRAMRGLVRLKLLMEGSVVKRQAANTLKCMQTLSRVQSQIRARRIRMSEENQARQKQLLQKHAKELAAALKNGDNWDDSSQSKEKVEAKLLSKYEATMRRERALAYAYTHQQNWKNNSKSGNPMFMDPSNPTWGWSWLERWMAGRPLDNSSEKEQNNDNAASVKSATKPVTRNNSTQPNTPSSARGGTPRKRNSFFSPPTPSRLNQSSRKSNDEDAKSTTSNRRHSISGSSVRDDESLAGSQTLPSYMVPTKSARARVKPQSPSQQESDGFADKASTKKRLSYPASPALPKPRRFSAPPKVESGSVAVTNGVGI